MQPYPPLSALVQRLRESGVPIGTRDYLDALTALGAGFGTGGREDLRRLCEALWARREEEARTIRLVFDDFVFPQPEAVRKVTGTEAPVAPASEPVTPTATTPTDREVIETPDQEPEVVPVEIAPEAGPAGIDIPRAQAAMDAHESFVLSDQPPVSRRSLIVSLRRFRRPLRSGPKVELDLHATIEAKGRRGLLTEPVLVPARRNQARLVVLIDASSSMIPWRAMRDVLIESLDHGQLAATDVYFFEDSPANRIYADAALLCPVELNHALRAHPDSALLIFSDAGAARGHRDTDRVVRIRRFLNSVSAQWAPCAWLNPMPQRRWRGSAARDIARLPNVCMRELSDDGVVQAIDHLRGYGG
jgi:uncharacterized protein with von Willebrand factor type A (vWA) domain